MTQESRLTRDQALLGAICLLLVGILLMNGWSINQGIQERERRTYYREQASAIRDLADLQDELIFDLMEEYQSSAYGSSVDRITEQQLIAAETQIVGLQTLALQNRQIIELLLLAYEEPPIDIQEE